VANSSLSVAERVYGLSLIWQEANYNFAFFDRIPDLDWDALYREYLPQVISAEDLGAYYDLLARFIARLQDGHTLVALPKALYLGLDRPKLKLMNIAGRPIVTNASRSIGASVPIGSALEAIDGVAAGEYLATRVAPLICETTPHRRADHATARLLLGPRGGQVKCAFRTPAGDAVELELERNRRADADPWLRAPGAPDPWEFMGFDEWLYNDSPFPSFEFAILEGEVAYVALHSFMDPTVATRFEEHLPAIARCAGLILDVRKNHGGSDSVGYSIAAHFLRQPTEPLLPRSPQHIAYYRAGGVALADAPADELAGLDETAREKLLCYRRRWFHQAHWGSLSPASETLALPTVILTSSETGSAAEDFVMAFEAGQSGATRIGQSTGGSSGQPLIQGLPGGGQFAICTIRMPWPEQVWRKGIEPHICVSPTVEDVIRNEDRTLAAARRYLGEGRRVVY